MTAFLPTDARYRTVPEAVIVEQMLTRGWIFEVSDGGRAVAEREARGALDRWVAMGLGYERSAAGERLFDSVEVINFDTWAGVLHGDPAWRRSVATVRRHVRELLAGAPDDSAPPPLAALGPRRFSVSFKREFDLAAVPVGARARLRLPRPLEDDALRDLTLTPFVEAGLEAEFASDAARIDVQIATPPERRAVAGFEAEFVAYPTLAGTAAAPLSAAERELYTRPGEGLVQVSPRIQALAEALAFGARDDNEAVDRFWRYLFDRLNRSAIHYDTVGRSAPLDGVLDGGRFDCQFGAALVAALCRARGIPARMVCGYWLYALAPAPHYWLEAWLPDRGWLPLDPASWELSDAGADARWRDYFTGAIDYRLKTQVLPRLFNGGGTVRLPASWRMLLRAEAGGLEVSYHDNDTGAVTLRDLISVRRPGAGETLAVPAAGE